jgi:chemotaxis protein methyltransferase WspC
MDICAAVEKKFADTLGISTAAYGCKTVERMISQAVKRTGAADAETYIERLSGSFDEMEHCLEDLVVPETWFFRDREPFVLLRQHLCGSWFPSHPGRTARILSLPCSSGEEPYSIAITLLDAGILPGRFHLDAADISRRALDAAKAADYGKGSFRQELTPSQEAHFIHTRRGRRLNDAVVKCVRFHRANIIDPSLFAGSESYDVIFCRNILIYLTDEARRKALANIDRLLAADGLLFTGHAEVGIFQQQGYTAVRHPRAFACRRAGKSDGERPARSTVLHTVSLTPPVPTGERFEICPQQTQETQTTPQTSESGALPADALALADQGRFDEAETLCLRYLRENPPHADVYCLLGLICETARRTEAAEEHYLKALDLAPDHYETLIHLSLLYRQRGDGRRASDYRRRAETAERRPDGNAAP